jgi:dephospho-CoA kinase
MPSLAITGNIGSGKTSVFHLLCKSLPGSTAYSADEMNRSLLENDHEVRKLIKKQLGDTYYDSTGSPDRKQLFHLITTDPSSKIILEEILHPRLEKIWKQLAERFKGTGDSFFVAEIPLLYEKRLETFFDKTIMVGCSDPLRKERLLKNRKLSADEVSRWLKHQLPQGDKVLRADYLLWNDSSLETLELEIKRLALQLMTQ